MRERRFVPQWLRRGLEAGIVGAVLSAASLLAFQVSRPEPRLTLPRGLDGALILLPAIVALGVLSITYPTLMAATRHEAILGAASGILIASDLLMIVSMLQRESVFVHLLSSSVPLGIVGFVLALPVAVLATIGGQSTASGFGRAAGLRSVMFGSVAAVLVALFGAYLL